MPSLYANLLDPKVKEAATISGEPVKYEFKKQEEAKEEKKKQDAALRFQPLKRPAVTQKQKPRPTAGSGFPNTKSPDNADAAKRPTPASSLDSGPKVSLDQFVTKDDEDEGDPFAAEYNRRMEEARKANKRGGRKKKKNQRAGDSNWVDWDAIYDPARPTRLDLYKGSEEQSQCIHDWKMRLHAHQLKDNPRHDPSSDEEDAYSRRPKQAFAPPPSMYAPPPVYENQHTQPDDEDGPGDTPSRHSPQTSESDHRSYIPPTPALVLPNDVSGDDVYLRRLRMSQPVASPAPAQPQQAPPGPSQASAVEAVPPPPPPPSTEPLHAQAPSMPLPATTPAPGTVPAPRPSADPAVATAPITYSSGPQLSAPPQLNTVPVEPKAPSASHQQEVTEDEEVDEPRSSRPGQKGFAKRLLEKYGWQEGQGLGASGDGITTILRHQPTSSKRKKRPDAEGGGFIGPAGGVARIVGGKRQRVVDEEPGDAAAGRGASWSVVAVFEGMLDGLDVKGDVEEGSLMQDLGERMGQYGVVERLYLHFPDASSSANGLSGKGGVKVFVKFTSALSAYRVVQASQDKDFLGNGRVAQSGFFDADKFEEGVYD